MSLKANVKKALFKLLTIEALGRPLRKIAFLTMHLSYEIYKKSVKFHERIPYVRFLAGKIDSLKLERVARYYLHLHSLKELFPLQPKISILIPVYKVKPHYLEEALQSISQQVYDNWEVCLVDDCSGSQEIINVIENFRKKFPDKVKFSINPQNQHISRTSNECLNLATGEYVALLDHDDRLYPNSLMEIVRYINLHGEPDILYSDERTVTGSGEKRNIAYFKPDWSPFMHLCMNYTTHLSCYRTSLLRKIGGFRAGFEGSQDHDLMLRAVENSSKPVVHIPLCLYQWRAHEESTAASVSAKPYAAIAGEKAVSEALQRRGRPCKVEYETVTQHYRLKFPIPKPEALVSIVIPSKNSYVLIAECLTSIFEKSTYSNFEVIISDNGTTDQQCLELYASFEKRYPGRFRALVKPAAFNFGRQINVGAREAKGAFLILLNNDTKIISPGWIEEMISLAQFEEVGAVGCKLLDSKNRIQHAGVLTAARTIAVHAGNFLNDDHTLYCNVLNTIHETIAVTGACLTIQTSKFFEVGGLDEIYLPNGYGDLEFCFKLQEKGYSHLYTPYAVLNHLESPSRGLAIEYFERYFLLQRRGQQLLFDPYSNPGLYSDGFYNIDPYYLDLDLNAMEYEFFLNTPRERWVDAARLLTKGKEAETRNSNVPAKGLLRKLFAP